MRSRFHLAFFAALIAASTIHAQTNPLWHEEKIKNYLPHMTWPEVEDLLTRTDMVIIPVASLEEHGPQTPIGTDFLNGVEEAKLIAQDDVSALPVVDEERARMPSDPTASVRVSSESKPGLSTG